MKFKAAPAFWKAFHKLGTEQKNAAREKFKIFRVDPFDQRLKTHKINKLSARFGKTVHSVTIEGNLRAAFYIEGDTVFTVDIGTHDIYK